ncbi:MAG TPA: SpoIIE family protein phosphatase, partial [Thermomicrobiales bacterium]|nr:SpoIIE family protein phosphatase [Thermomicrobiales bacterium]
MRSVDIAVAKTHKYASRDSGDTAEMVERPTGGVSVVLVDGQGSGAAAKSLSMMISSKAVSLLKEGVRDGAVARGTHDFLHAYRHGRVSATLDILSVDLASSTVLVTRNSDVAYIIRGGGSARCSEPGPGPIGLYRHTRPAVDQFPIEDGVTIIMFTDGVVSAGVRAGVRFMPLAFVEDALRDVTDALTICDRLLSAA